jgi:type II secretory pathway pseudopilin PulG
LSKSQNVGFTLVEVCSVLGIVLLVAALSFPALQSSKRSAKVTLTIQKLRNVHFSSALYRSDHDGDGRIGTSSEMGLPSAMQLYVMVNRERSQKYFQKSEFEPGCDWYPLIHSGFTWGPPDDRQSEWYPVVIKHGEGFPLVFTTGCTPPRSILYNPYLPTYFLGTAIDGRLLKFSSIGSVESAEYWMKKE